MLRVERRELRRMMAQQRHHVAGRAIPDTKPDHLRRCAPEHAQPMEIFVLRHEEAAVCAGEFPYRNV